MKSSRFPNTYVIIFIVIALCAVATWFVPGGKYVVSEGGGVSYESVEAVPQTWQIFTSLYNGFVKQAGIIIFILVVGGAFWILNATGAVSAGISRFIISVGSRDKLVLVSIAILFSVGGAVFGMSEETIPFVAMVVPMVVSLGYDAFTGMLIVYVAANVGFSAAFLNPFTVGVAQQMCELPLFSGMGYRLCCWGLLTALLVIYVLFYASRHKSSPIECGSAVNPSQPLTRRHKSILVLMMSSMVVLIVGVIVWKWYIAEISALFLVMGLVSGAIAGFGPNRIADEFLTGAKDILSAALVVGLASGIIVILQDGNILDSMLHGLQAHLSDGAKLGSASAMYGIEALINLFIPSATAKAAITMPVMAPFADMVGVSRQTLVLAFQFGDGFTNMITPTSGVLLASLAMAHIPYEKWVKMIWKAVAVLLVLGFILLLPPVMGLVSEF